MNYMADISSNQGSFNAGAYASSHLHPLAIMIKATQGDWYVNPLYRTWTREAHRHGLAVIHYHFCEPPGAPGSRNTSFYAQMDHFWNTVHPYFRRPGDYLSLDLEWGNPRECAGWLLDADAHLRAISDTHPWVYTFLSYFLEGRITINSKNVHIAAWGSQRPGNLFWKLPFGQNLVAWQNTDGRIGPEPHSVAGIPSICDGNILNPSLARSLKKQLNKRRK